MGRSIMMESDTWKLIKIEQFVSVLNAIYDIYLIYLLYYYNVKWYKTIEYEMNQTNDGRRLNNVVWGMCVCRAWEKTWLWALWNEYLLCTRFCNLSRTVSLCKVLAVKLTLLSNYMIIDSILTLCKGAKFCKILRFPFLYTYKNV